MLNTTFAKLHKHGACPEGYQKLARSLGGINKYGKDTLIPLDKIIESNGLQDTIWALRATTESSENLIIEFACQCAEHVLHFYTDKYPDDKRPQLAIEAARVCITDKSEAARAAAWDAAGDAAWEAAEDARDAARAAAWAGAEAARTAAWNARTAAGAAGDIEEKWQIEQFLELLNK